MMPTHTQVLKLRARVPEPGDYATLTERRDFSLFRAQVNDALRSSGYEPNADVDFWLNNARFWAERIKPAI
jgi:hypothetical protein